LVGFHVLSIAPLHPVGARLSVWFSFCKDAGMSMTPQSFRRFVSSFGWISLSALLLAGCAMPPRPTPVSEVPHPNMDAALMRSVSQIQQVTDDLRAAHSVAWQGTYQGFPMRDGVSPSDRQPPVPQVAPVTSGPGNGPLAQRMYVQWSGPVDTLGRALAEKLGWIYQDSSGLGDQLDVSVYGRNETVLNILRTMARQLPDSVSLRVTPGKIVLEPVGEAGE